jgi:hypothetical protein
VDTSVAVRNMAGGTAPNQVLVALRGARKLIGKRDGK